MFDDNSEIDPKAIAAEIGADLLGGGDSGLDDDTDNFQSDPPPEKAPDLGKTAPVSPEGQPGLTPAQIKALPKSWKKEMEPLWQKADPALHDYVYNREADVMRGLQQYQEGHQSWQKLLQPYQAVLQQHPNVQPVQLLQNLMNSHLGLLSALPAQKVEMARRILTEYGIDIAQLVGDGTTPAPTLDPRVNQIQQELESLKQERLREQKRIYDEGVAEQEKIIQKFASDPKNKYYSEVEMDIYRFIEKGVATDLAHAYELACYANPAVRAKIIAEQTSPAPATPSPAEKFPNLDGETSTKGRRQRQVTMDDTINSIINKHHSTH